MKKIFNIIVILLLSVGIAYAAATAILSLTALATGNIADTDMFNVVDVSDTTMDASGTNKKYSWASMKADIKTYADTLYQVIITDLDILPGDTVDDDVIDSAILDHSWETDITVPDEAYNVTNWNSSLEVPTKNAVRDQFSITQPYDADLQYLAGVTLSDNVKSILTSANYAAVKALISVDDLVTLSGVADGAVNLGTFTGSTIADSQTIKAGLQALETAVEGVSASGSETQVIFRGASAYEGDAGMTYVKATDILTVAGGIVTGAGTGVSFTGDGDGAVTLLGLGDGSDENIILNLDDVANTMGVSSGTGLDKIDFGAIALATSVNTKNQPKHLRFTIVDPTAVKAKDAEVCIWPITDAALTVTSVRVTLNADPTTEFTGDLAYCDAFIGQANSTVINALDTATGVLSDTSMTSGAVASGKCIYVILDAIDAATTQISVDVIYDYD